jgi:hypothetical protein
MKTYLSLLTALVLIIGAMPAGASAAAAYLESTKSTMSVGDTAVLTLKVNAEGATINTVEGNVVLESTVSVLSVHEFSLANSVFGLWPRTPSLSNDGKTISFVGGVPGGFTIEGATLFKIIVQAEQEGTVTISPQDIAAFANDGKGTKLPAQGKSLVIQVVPKDATPLTDDWQAIVASDKTAPEAFTVVLGQDASIFDGKTFAFFSALDNQSGVSHYEVSENGAPAVRSGSTYVLQNQTGTTTLIVTAYDKAGNKKVATYPATEEGPAPTGVAWPLVVAIVLLMVVGFAIYKKFRKRT